MGFGGSAQSMITILKNNKNMLSEIRNKKHSLTGYKTTDTEFKIGEASPQVLREIRERLQKEQRSKRRKILILFGLIMSLILSVFIYFY
ncbi:hypothetical protein [Hanstruepera ponticola]|uniref:hypothetical protein n=1 Tax=Hanstruepera ponticola TaxID=2042995 RepID=UPI001783D35B|nr:hypothetical protein [Hanstruepera ponticola]